MSNVVQFGITFLPYLQLKFHLKQHFTSYISGKRHLTVYNFSPIVKPTKLYWTTFLISFCCLPRNYTKECFSISWLVLYKKPFFIFWFLISIKNVFLWKKMFFYLFFFVFYFSLLFSYQYLAFYYLNSWLTPNYEYIYS